YLQNNQFTGTLDVLANLPLENLNFENNQFIGWVPAQLKGIKSLKTGGNQWFSGPAPPGPPRRAKPRLKSDENGNDKSDSNGDGKKSGLGAGGIAGILVALLVVVGAAVAFFLIKKKRSKSHRQILKSTKKIITSFLWLQMKLNK
ncbi:hypothetical protein MKX03_032033, partial [Papaver bracteatum]